jgi:adenosylcobinamide-phosphate synthase
MNSWLKKWARWVSDHFDAAKPRSAWIAWSGLVLLPAFLSVVVHWTLWLTLGWPSAMLFQVVVLYLTLGFRQFSHHFTAIRDALAEGDEALARELLSDWKHVDASELTRTEIVRHVIEYSVLASHRHVFGVLSCYAILAALGGGPAGAVLYRLAQFAKQVWCPPVADALHPISQALQERTQRSWQAVDWLAARLTALVFAVVGNFEEAIEGWRVQARRAPDDGNALVLAAAAGALNVRLGGGVLRRKPRNNWLAQNTHLAEAPGLAEGLGLDDDNEVEPDLGPMDVAGQQAEVGHLVQVVGLVWRSVVVWLVLLALLTLARLVG